ncbi:glycosyltransferase [Flavobacterium sp. 245]|uniref:glycosyltransferase n=1 Tax=Flavobacterium sp. 245 TaxID=2512115 RepID=UPI00105C2506|nr:glycosyltransferase [Flavobacterium sp. 245]TDP00903.1 glycosyltransferase involved in cell wall biosynthesis [Flavobacterium sp. 245]
MILVDAIYVNNGGGRILLDYLIQELEQTNIEVFYLIDSRIEFGFFQIKDTNKIVYQESSLSKRFLFYKKNKSKFKKVFVLGNVPPPVKLNAIVFTYFHNSILFNVPKEFSFIEKVKYKLKVFLVNFLKKNTNYWLLQSDILKEQFVQKFGEKEKTNVLPFYPPLGLKNEKKDKITQLHTYLYVSNAQENKNHSRLIEGFCKFYDKHHKGKLIVTVSKKYIEIFDLIQEKINKDYPIENLGFIEREKLIDIYEKSEYVIFPSLSESFGLGIIEGIELGCNVIASDLPYTYAVCEPSIVFNPNDIDSIFLALELSLQTMVSKSKLKTYNQIDKLISKLN